METPERSQKEIAQSYRGNLAYLRKLHPFRTLRLLLFVGVVVASVGVALGYRYINRKEFFSTGPISQNHSKFAENCQVCHEGTDPDVLAAAQGTSLVRKLKEGKFGEIGKADFARLISVSKDPHASDPDPAAQLLKATGGVSSYDAACIKCHEPYQLHQPSAAALNLTNYYGELGLVHAGSCSTCHREHQGPEKMKLPPSNNCASCHNDIQQLRAGLVLKQTGAKLLSRRAEVHETSDKVRRFIPPRAAPHEPVAFDSFAKKHPDFGYQQADLRDAAELKYNHLRHRQEDVVGANGRRQLDCIGCHRLGADGVYMQRVSFDNDCRRCHSLSLDPEVQEIQVPHGSPTDVQRYLQTLASQYLAAAKQRGIVAPEQQREFVQGRLVALQQMGYTDIGTMERRIFYEGDRLPTERITSKSNTGQSFPACAKCHTVSKIEQVGQLPRIALTNAPDRWLTRGPFTHFKHLHMECYDCHSGALASSKTSDILMPTKALCADCHRPLKTVPTDPTIAAQPLGSKNAELVAQQRREGGIVFECGACHGKFHAPAGATVFALDLPQPK